MNAPKSSSAANWNDAPALQESELFRGIDPYLRQLWLERCSHHSFESGEAVITATARIDRIYMLLEGELVVPIAPEQGTERLRQAIEDSARIEVTVSIGVATQASDESWHQVLKRADQALYSAKHSGRNQVQLS